MRPIVLSRSDIFCRKETSMSSFLHCQLLFDQLLYSKQPTKMSTCIFHYCGCYLWGMLRRHYSISRCWYISTWEIKHSQLFRDKESVTRLAFFLSVCTVWQKTNIPAVWGTNFGNHIRINLHFKGRDKLTPSYHISYNLRSWMYTVVQICIFGGITLILSNIAGQQYNEQTEKKDADLTISTQIKSLNM